MVLSVNLADYEIQQFNNGGLRKQLLSVHKVHLQVNKIFGGRSELQTELGTKYIKWLHCLLMGMMQLNSLFIKAHL